MEYPVTSIVLCLREGIGKLGILHSDKHKLIYFYKNPNFTEGKRVLNLGKFN